MNGKQLHPLRRAHFMTVIVDALYQHGKIELLGTPHGLPEGRIRLILIAEDPAKPPPRLLTFAKYAGDQSTLEDFKDAQWHGDDRMLDEPHAQ
jgi:hypothetical protein